MTAACTGLAILLIAAATCWFAFVRETDEDRYLSELRSSGLISEFGNDKAAVAQGTAFCAALESGESPTGFKSERLAVKHFCSSFLDGFVVIPTPAEKQELLATELRDRGLGGKFSSDAAAVAHAENVCERLDDGAKQQGPEEDAVAVTIYCDRYAAGFKTLHPIKVKATFTLSDTAPSIYYPSIVGDNENCSGASGYSDITMGTEVVVKNASGEVLTTTSLGQGTGIVPVSCEFAFKFTVMDGETDYTIEVGRRGDLHFTAAELKIPGSVAISLG